jgi:TolB-like protein
MKRMWVVAALAILCGCASSGKTGPAGLDAAIQQASKEINDSLPQGTKVALLNFTSSSDVFSDYVLEEMSIALVKGRKLVVVDRKEIDLIRGEMNFQMSGEVNDESAQEIGKMLGAQSIVSGSLVNMGESYRFRIKVINVLSAAIETSSSISIGNDPQIRYLMGQGGRSSTLQTVTAQGGTQSVPAQAGTSGQTQPAQPATTAVPVVRTYRIGETGPAGGLIFYDKGNNSDGWRYLEAAPEDLPRKLKWSTERFEADYEFDRSVGKGKPNTQAIMAGAAKIGGGFGWAAQACTALTINGFNDWFLPSRDELHYMYGHLHMQGLGGFRNESYWSSTFAGLEWLTIIKVWNENFSNGEQQYQTNTVEYRVRPIRQVPGPN